MIMYCTACGAYLKEEHNFCTNCGAQRPISDPGPRGSRIVPILFTALMFLFGLAVYGFQQFG
jgi:hypothetical protein